MEKLICLNCGETFHTPVEIREHLGPEWESAVCIPVSPCCLAPFAQAVACDSCGVAMAPDESSHGLCRSCARKAVERLKRILKGGFTPAEREVLNEAFDGVPLTLGERGVGHERV